MKIITDFQTEKDLVLQFYRELDAATENELHSVLSNYITEPNPLLKKFGWTCDIVDGAFVAAGFFEGLGGLYASRIAGRLGI